MMIGYATAQELVDYAAARGVIISIDDAPVLLTRALDWIEMQALAIPDPAPEAIKKAQMVAAMLLHGGADLFAVIGGQRVASERVEGAVSVSYDNSSNQQLWPQLEALIAPYRAGGLGFNQFRVERG